MMDNRPIHVYPINDTYPHITSGLGCPCKPKVEKTEGGTLIVHNSYDGRERAEKTTGGGVKQSKPSESKRQQGNRAERRASKSKAKGATRNTKHRGIGRAK
jgi:hypothetical protein